MRGTSPDLIGTRVLLSLDGEAASIVVAIGWLAWIRALVPRCRYSYTRTQWLLLLLAVWHNSLRAILPYSVAASLSRPADLYGTASNS